MIYILFSLSPIELIFVIFGFASNVEGHDFELFGCFVLVDFGCLSLGDDHSEVVSFLVSNPVVFLYFEPMVIKMMVKGWDKELVLNFCIDRNININNPVAKVITLKPEGTVDVPFSQLRNVSHKVDGLAELKLLLKNEAIADCGHGLVET